ncbi:MAG: beta strand repeat-containing protein, partial [Xanthobacteraceae bacterium]
GSSDNGVDAFEGHASGNTLIQSNNNHNTLNFSGTTLTNIREIDAGGGNDTVTASNLSNASYRGGAGDDTLIAGDANATWLYSGQNNGFDTLQNGNGTSVARAETSGTTIGIGNFNNGVDAFEGHAGGDTLIQSNSSHNTLNFSGTTLTNIREVDAGAGNDTVTASNLSNASYRGGAGDDTLIAGDANATFLYSGTNNGFDTLQNGNGTSVARAETSGTTIGIGNFNNGVDAFEGHASGDTLIQSNGSHNTLNFSGTTLTNIREIDAGAGNDTVTASNLSNASYRGGVGDDTLIAGDADATWLYSGQNNGFDTLQNGNGTSVAKAEAAGTVIGVGNYANGADAFEGTGDTIIRSTSGHNTLDFSKTTLTGIATLDAGGGNDTVYTATNTGGEKVVYDGNTGTDTLVITLTLAQAMDTTVLAQIAALVPGVNNGSVNAGGLNFEANNFENFQIRVRVGDTDIPINNNVWIGTANHDTGAPYTPELSVPLYKGSQVNQAWTIFGMGGDDKITGGNGNDLLIGGIGRDTMDGGKGSDTYLIGPGDGPTTLGDNFTDTGTAGYDRILAAADGTQIVINALSGIEEISANGFSGVNIAGAGGAHNVLNLSQTKLVGIEEVRGGGSTSNDTFYTSNDSDAAGGQAYRGGKGSDVFNLGTQNTRLLVSADDNGGFDTFNGNTFGDSVVHTVIVEGDGTNVGLSTNYGGSNTVDVIDASGATNTSLIGSSGAHNNWDLSTTVLKGISVVDVGGGNDTVRTAVNADGHITYKGGSGTDTLYVSLTAAQATNPAVLAAIAALTPGSGSNGTVNVGGLNFSAEGFESFKIGIAAGNTYLPIEPANLWVGTSNHDTGAPYTPALSVPDFKAAQINQAWAIFGLGGDDKITGGNGNDVIVGGIGRDTMDGGNGSDTYLVGPGDSPPTYGDNFHDTGATGYDRIVATGDGTQIVINGTLSGIEEINSGGFSGVNIVGAASAHNNIDLSQVNLVGIEEIRGGGVTSNDTIIGSSGNDRILGLGGNDKLYGGDGNDTLIGGLGNDTLTGGNGADTFVLDSFTGTDIITDYNGAEGDVIDLTALFSDSDPIGNGILSRAGNQLFVDFDGAGGNAAHAVATFTANPAANSISILYHDANNHQATLTI